MEPIKSRAIKTQHKKTPPILTSICCFNNLPLIKVIRNRKEIIPKKGSPKIKISKCKCAQFNGPKTGDPLKINPSVKLKPIKSTLKITIKDAIRTRILNMPATILFL